MSSSLTETAIVNQALDLLDEAPIASLDSDTTSRAKWFQRNYETTRDALLRAHPWKFAIKRRRLYPGVLALDGIDGTLSGAWGLIRLTPFWTGSLVTIREDAGDTTQNFSVGTDNVTVETTEIADFVGTADAYITQLYDQSNNARHLVQATTTKQPFFDPSLEDVVLPAAVFDGSSDLMATAAALSTMISTSVGYIVIVAMIDALTANSATATSNALLVGDASSKIGLYARDGGALYGVNDDGSVDTTTDHCPLQEVFVAEIRHTGGILYTRVNGGTEQSATSGSTSSLAGILNVGDLTGGSHALDLNLFALMTFSVIPSETNRDRLVERLMRWSGAGGREAFAWDYAYRIPDDSLRMLPLSGDGEFGGTPISHSIEYDDTILTDQGTQIYARYISRMTDPTRFDAQFVEALAAKLAFKAAHWITGKASYAQTMQGIYNQAIADAKASDAFEGTPEPPYDSEVITARYATGDSI